MHFELLLCLGKSKGTYLRFCFLKSDMQRDLDVSETRI